MQLYLDCDGVLADFDSAATGLLGAPPRVFQKRHGLGEFWNVSSATPISMARFRSCPMH
jgi:hypothetical protein